MTSIHVIANGNQYVPLLQTLCSCRPCSHVRYRRHGNFRGLNFQEVKFSWIAAPHENLNPAKILLSKIFTRAQWPKRSPTHRAVTQALCVRGYHVYEDIWEVAVGETTWRNS